MKKLNLICGAIVVAFSVGSASAGTLASAQSGGSKYATENFGGSTSAATDPIQVAPITYNFGSATAVNAGQVLWFTVRLSGGKLAAAPVFGEFVFGGVTCLTDVIGGGRTTASTNLAPGCSATLSADNTTYLLKVTTVSASTTTLGLGALIWTPAAASIDNVNATLATATGTVTASIGVTTAQPTSASLQSTVTQATIDSPVATGPIAVSAATITPSAGKSTYAGKIDLTATPAASAYTTTLATLGTFKFVETTATAGQRAAAATAYQLTAGSANATNGGATVTVTPTVGVFPIGSVLSLHTAVTCGAAVAATTGTGTVAMTSATQASAKTLVTTTAVANDTPWFVCMSAPSTGNTAAPLTATISAVVKPGATTDLIATASATGYALDYNGSTIDTNAFWGSAVSAAGYSSYVRVINTGSVAAPVSMAYIDPTTGAAGTSAVVITSLAAGTSKMLTAKEIETAVGASPFGYSAGRLRVTAPTNGMKTQSFLQTATGAPQEVSGAQ